MNMVNLNPKLLKGDGAWHRIAWGFLKVSKLQEVHLPLMEVAIKQLEIDYEQRNISFTLNKRSIKLNGEITHCCYLLPEILLSLKMMFINFW